MSKRDKTEQDEPLTGPMKGDFAHAARPRYCRCLRAITSRSVRLRLIGSPVISFEPSLSKTGISDFGEDFASSRSAGFGRDYN